MTTYALALWEETQDKYRSGKGSKKRKSQVWKKILCSQSDHEKHVITFISPASKIFGDSLHVTKDGQISPVDDQEACSRKLLKKRAEKMRSKSKLMDSGRNSKDATTSSGLENELSPLNGSSDSQAGPDAPEGRPYICANFPDVTLEDIGRFGMILGMARMLQMENLQNVETQTQASERDGTKPSPSKQIPLLEGSSIQLPELELQGIVNSCGKNPRRMVRRFMLLILGKETLLKSSPTGKGGWTPIPEHISEEVESKDELKSSETRETRCSTQPSKRKKKQCVQKSKDADGEKDDSEGSVHSFMNNGKQHVEKSHEETDEESDESEDGVKLKSTVIGERGRSVQFSQTEEEHDVKRIDECEEIFMQEEEIRGAIEPNGEESHSTNSKPASEEESEEDNEVEKEAKGSLQGENIDGSELQGTMKGRKRENSQDNLPQLKKRTK
ncbi:hypothetical protein QAD02_008226 [Eretmocerus hayati]|uniref:Uncharacterized protein n=1 Tax=Eretmocerus hayati TaxID=131215 RepID=A0ACC2N5V5_9HYME|nr:hypothetical protein QAD02_008226 [Eretmocerus hayati]